MDTGSAYSIIPHQFLAAASGPAIMAADCTPILCWGSCKRTLTTGGQRFMWSFLKAAVAFPILGANFLEAFDLMVDLKRGRLVSANRFNAPLSATPPGCTIASIGVVAVGSSTPSVGSSSPSVGSSSPSAGYTVGGCPQGRPKPPVLAQAPPSIADSFPEVVNASKKLPPVKHKVQHMIETTCQRPISSRYRRLPHGKLEAAKKEYADMEAQWIIRKAKGS